MNINIIKTTQYDSLNITGPIGLSLCFFKCRLLNVTTDAELVKFIPRQRGFVRNKKAVIVAERCAIPVSGSLFSVFVYLKVVCISRCIANAVMHEFVNVNLVCGLLPVL